MILIMLVALLIFGPKKLPEIGRSMGKAIKGFQDASREFESEFKRESDRLEQEPAIAKTTSSAIPDDDVATPVAAAVEVLTTPETKEVSKIADA
jgi:sec-independent protein translocase protein TatA